MFGAYGRARRESGGPKEMRLSEKNQAATTPSRPMPVKLLAGFALLLLFQLIGEVLVHAVRLLAPAFAFPGPVAGMLLLLAFLLMRRRLDGATDAVATGLIGILSLLFVPAAVGVIQYGDVLLAWGGPLMLAVLLSTVATLLATVGTFLLVVRLMEKGQS